MANNSDTGEVFSLANVLYTQMEGGASVGNAVLHVQVRLQQETGVTKLRVEHVVSTAACRAIKCRNESVLKQLLLLLQGAKDQYPFEIMIGTLIRRGEYSSALRNLITCEEALSPEFVSKQKVAICKKILAEEKPEKFLYGLLNICPNDEVLNLHCLIQRALILRSKSRNEDAQQKVGTIKTIDKTINQPLAWELLQIDFPEKAFDLMNEVDDKHVRISYAIKLLDKKSFAQAVEMILPVVQQGVEVINLEDDGIAFNFEAITLYADCARNDQSLAAGFERILIQYQTAGVIPETYCDALRYYCKTGKRLWKGGNVAKFVKPKEDDDTKRSGFFEHPHDVLRAKPINKVAGRVIEKDLKRKKDK